MRIVDVKAHVLQFEAKSYHWRDGLGSFGNTREGLLLRVIGQDGTEGWAVGRKGRPWADIVANGIKPAVVGEDSRYRELIWQKMWDLDRIQGFPGRLLGMLDVAIWDLAGKEAGLPVYQLLGGYRDKVKAYASTLTLDSVDEYRQLAREVTGRGYTAIKLHLWGRPRQDVEVCKAVRESVGPEMPLMVDASGGYNHEEALWVGQELEKLGYAWYEEPVRDYDVYGLQMLHRKLAIPLVVTETSWGGLFDTATHIMDRTGDIIHADVWLNHGVIGCMKTAHLCEAFGIKCAIHGSGVHNLHVICAIKNCEYYESLVPEGQNDPQVFVGGPILPDKDGFVHVPQGPGFGVDVDWQWVEGHTVETV